MTRQPNKTLSIIAVIMIGLGILLLIGSVGFVEQAFVGVETPAGTIKADGLSQTSATMIIVGAVLIAAFKIK